MQLLLHQAYQPAVTPNAGWPKLLGTAVICASASSMGTDLFKTTDTLELLYFPPGKLQATPGSVRLRARGRDIARVDHETAIWLGPLLAVHAITTQSSYITRPRSVKMGSQVMLSVDVFANYDAFNQLPTLQSDTSDNSATGDAIAIVARAWQRCLSSVGLVHDLPLSAASHAPATAEVDDDDDDRDLQFVCEQMGQMDADLPEAEPADSFISTLRAYQKQALGWLVEREELASASTKATAQLHPLWTQLTFQTGEPFYWKRAAGQVSIHFPSAAKQSRGGILADAMVRYPQPVLSKTDLTRCLWFVGAGQDGPDIGVDCHAAGNACLYGHSAWRATSG